MLKRVGLIIPSVNTVIEAVLRRFCPNEVQYHVTRVQLNASSEAALARAVAEIPEAAERLHDAGLDAIALACTGAAMVGGADPAWCARIAGPDPLPMTTTTAALGEAFTALGASSVALFSPFEPWFNDKEADMLRQAGLAVSGTHGLGYANPRACAVLTPEEIVAGGLAADSVEADVIFLSCANIRAMEAVAPLEARTGKPVVTSNQVVLWWLLRTVGVAAAILPGRLAQAGIAYHA